MAIHNKVDMTIRDICSEIQKWYEGHFAEIVTDRDHAHFLVQSVPSFSGTKLLIMIKNITARHVLESMHVLKKKLLGAHLWTSGWIASFSLYRHL